jgi:AcrR family transcriptional regulator
MNMAVETSLRERQKVRRRADILAAGRALFNLRGYSATSMEAIAEVAEVGIATVYNYFGSKGRLLAAILRPDFDLMYEQGEAVLAQPPENPGSGVLSLIEVYQRFQGNWERKDLLIAIMGPGLSAEPALDELASVAESKVKTQLGALLRDYQKSGKIRQGIDIDDAALIIFFIFNQHFIQYVSQDVAEFSAMKAAMDRQIRFIVSAIC